MDPLSGIENIPWSRLVHWFGRATEIPRWIRDLSSDKHAEAERQLLGCLEHQDGVMQATPFAVWFIVRMLNAGAVRDPDAVRRMLGVIQAAARYQIECRKQPVVPLESNALLSEEHLWPEFRSERDDEIQWERWSPTSEEWDSWIALTDKFITEGLKNPVL